MRFEEIFVFVVVGCIASYWQRSPHRSHIAKQTNKPNKQAQVFILWLLAIVLPSLAIAWTTISHTALPLNLVTVTFLLCVWIYSSLISSSNPNSELIELEPVIEKQLKDCFPSVVYHLQGLEYRPHEIYCRGNLRSQNSKYAYETVNNNIQKIFGDRFICYLQETPLENLGTGFGNTQDSQESTTKYCFYLRPNYAIADQTRQVWIASTISIIFTSITVLAVGANINKLEDLSLINLQRGIPYFLAIASIFIARAIAKYYITNKYKVRFVPPILLPCLGGFGWLGSLNDQTMRIQNPTNQRRYLFDLAVIPNIAGLIISMLLLLLGNWLFVPVNLSTSSTIIDPAIAPSFLIPNLNTFDFKNSILANLLQTFFSFGKISIPANTIPTFSPLTLAGWSGLALSALQLMPFDLLDGGNLIISMFGHRQAIKIARVARLGLLAIAFLVQPWLRIYSLLLFILPTPRPLILNEHIEICKTRDFVGMILMAISLLIILPIPKLHI